MLFFQKGPSTIKSDGGASTKLREVKANHHASASAEPPVRPGATVIVFALRCIQSGDFSPVSQ
jgi:hypothetical protein